MLTLLVSMAAATPLEVSLEGLMTEGQPVEISVSGVVPGEIVYVGYSQSEGTTCPGRVAPWCLDIASPTLIRRGRPATDSLTFQWVLPADAVGATIQAISVSGVSEPKVLASEVVIDDGTDLFLEIMTVVNDCAGDETTLLVEYLGVADQVQAHAYRSGALLGTYDLQIDGVFSDYLIGLTEPTPVQIADCGSVTWVFEASSTDVASCMVDGVDADDLVSGDYGDCYVW